MKSVFSLAIAILFASSLSYSQEPVPVLRSGWQRITVKASRAEVEGVGPVTPVMDETKNFQRKAREQRTDNPLDPNEVSIEGRSRAMDKAVKESRTPQPEDQNGFLYTADIRNDAGQTVEIIYLEYRFTEIARPTNIVKRQFLCGVNLKNGAKMTLSGFSLLGPSDTIDAESLTKTGENLFKEDVSINRIELKDGNVLQRNGWKFQEVKEAVDRVTSTPWGRDICRAL